MEIIDEKPDRQPLFEELQQLRAENDDIKQESRLYRQLLRCIASPQCDCVDDLQFDIKDWLNEIDRIVNGEKPIDVFGCENCLPQEYNWKCLLCKVLKP